MNMIGESLRIGAVEVTNRLAMAPLAVYKATEDGKVTPALCAHYLARAQAGNVGLIVTEHCFVAPEGRAKPRQVSVARDGDAMGLSALADACRAPGVAAFCQISHAGGAAREALTGLQPVAPSALVSPAAPPLARAGGAGGTQVAAGDGVPLPRELSREEIAGVVDAFAAAARRVKAAGFDGVEMHSAHAYLLDQFYSPLMNRRGDEYGGTLENRLRIHREVLEAVRGAVGPDFPVSVRLGGCDYEEGGATISDAVAAARILEAAGADMLSISGGWHRYERPGHKEPGWFAGQSAAVREAVGIPVLVAGGVKTLDDAERLLAGGACDIVGVGRALLGNAGWPN